LHFRNGKGSIRRHRFHMLESAFGSRILDFSGYLSKGSTAALRAPLHRSLWNRAGKHNFIQEVKEHEKARIPY
jgi:hypothetical protein